MWISKEDGCEHFRFHEKKRCLLEKKKRDTSAFTDDEIIVVSTFGCDKKLTKILDQVQSNSNYIKFKYVKKTGPSFQNLLCKYGRTIDCKWPTCHRCVLKSNKKIIKTARAKCNTRNVI